MAWTRFFDMSSGGGEKLAFPVIWIEAPEREAVELFKQIFGRNPYNVTCQCCGEDYSVREREQPEFEDGHAVVTVNDIAKFRGGLQIAAENE